MTAPLLRCEFGHAWSRLDSSFGRAAWECDRCHMTTTNPSDVPGAVGDERARRRP